MLPIAVGTSYFFNNILVDKYLANGKYQLFALYLFYSIVVSLWLEMILVLIAFIFLANYRFPGLYPPTDNILQMGIVLYLIVFADGFRITFLKFKKQQQLLVKLENAGKTDHIIIVVDRRQVMVMLKELLFVESLGDYLKVHTEKGTFITREKISHIADRLPRNFIRIHRSYLVNSSRIHAFSKETVTMNGQELPISRTYKSKVLDYLTAGN
jgi:hypothetical protein